MDKSLTETLSTVQSNDKSTEVQNTEDLVAHLRSRISVAESSLKRYQSSQGGRVEIARTVAEAVRAATPYPRAKFLISKTMSSTKDIAAVLELSDLHIGELIRPEETEGFGAFNFAIAQERMFLLGQKLLEWVQMHRMNFNITKLHIMGIGDYVSGNIHQELMVTNEFPLPVQTANAGLLIGEFVNRLAPYFEEIVFIGVGADNHGRLQPKPQAKQKATNSMSFLVHAIIEQYLKKNTNIKFIFSEGMKYNAEIAGHKFLIEHGDTIKAVLGIPYYGIERMSGRESRRRMGTDKEFNYHAIGHWHVPGVVSGNVLMNGSLSGTTEYDHSAGRHALPSQASFLVHPTYGVFDWTAWKFKVEEKLK